MVQDRVGMPEGAWVHYGLTSSDVVDTALCYSLAHAMDIVIDDTVKLRDALTKLSTEEVQVKVIASGVGGITVSDVQLAAGDQRQHERGQEIGELGHFLSARWKPHSANRPTASLTMRPAAGEAAA